MVACWTTASNCEVAGLTHSTPSWLGNCKVTTLLFVSCSHTCKGKKVKAINLYSASLQTHL